MTTATRGTRTPLSRKSRGRRLHKSDVSEVCCRCSGEIPAGKALVLDVTKTAAHPDCASLKVSRAQERPRFIQDNPVGRSCEGCGFEIEEGERVVHILTLPWHHECRLRENRRT